MSVRFPVPTFNSRPPPTESLMTPENRGRLARSLVVAIRVDEASNQVEVELVNFAADNEASEAA